MQENSQMPRGLKEEFTKNIMPCNVLKIPLSLKNCKNEVIVILY